MRNTEINSTRKGFTLVEVIVVLVILAILAAIAIPAMTGWIDKARERRLIVACRACVIAAHTLLVEEYGAAGTLNAPDSADIVALAGVEGTATVDEQFESNPGQIHKFTYSDGTDSIEYDADACNNEHKYFIFHAGGAHSFGKTEDMNTIKEALYYNQTLSTIDSKASEYETSGAYKVNETLKEMGINLSALGANSWRFKQDEYGDKLMWTDKDIATMAPGKEIVIMQYRFTGDDAGKFSVWKAKVVANENEKYGGTYNIIGSTNGKPLQQGTDYETALEAYNVYNH